jgi:hypothetical protein
MISSAGLDPVADASAIAYLDRLNRYARHAERSYYRAIRELRAIQNERAAKEEDDEPRVIQVRWIDPETKRTSEKQEKSENSEAEKLKPEEIDRAA